MKHILPTRIEWAKIVRGCVLAELEMRGPLDLFAIGAYIGFDIGATHEQVAYAVRVLSERGYIVYERKWGTYRKAQA